MNQLSSNNYKQSFINLDEISEWKDFYLLASEWNQLLSNSRADTLFSTHEWLSVWIKHFGEDVQPFILTARDNDTDELLGIAPLVIEKKVSVAGIEFKKLSFMGNGRLEIDHLDFIICKEQEERIAEQFAEYIYQQDNHWDKIYLDGLIPTSKTLKHLLEYSSAGKTLLYTETCPYLPLPDSWDELKQKFGKNLRYNLGRYQRKLEKAFPEQVEFNQVKTKTELTRAMSNLYHLHHLVQVSVREQDGIFSDKQVAEFHQEISKVTLETDQLSLFTLSVEDNIIAVLYCFKYKGRVLYYQAGYDPEWQNYSPGRQLMAYAIEKSIEDHATEFDFLRGDESYKATWTEKYRTECRVHLSSSIKGQTSMLPLLARRTVKNLIRGEHQVRLSELTSI